MVIKVTFLLFNNLIIEVFLYVRFQMMNVALVGQ